VIIAIGYLHKSKIIYRDLKPENILLNEDGYIKLADFGLARMIDEQVANSFCGTPEYLSPEMIDGSGHDQTLDWWTVGILLYEMLVGITPFYNTNQKILYQLIQFAPVKFPERQKHGFELSPEAVDLINGLLTKDKMKRLGKGEGYSQILSHPFFKNLNLIQLEKKELQPPVKPQVKELKEIIEAEN